MTSKTEERLEAVTDAVLTASRALVAVAARSLAEHEADVSIQQYRTLVVLASRGAQRPVDLASALGVDPSTITRLCDRLVRRGLISRLRASADRREVRLALTDAGTALVASVTTRRRAEIRRIVGRLSADRQQELIEALASFNTAAGELSDSEWPRSWEL
jgi:DNA-binding MarR family transcriptional regulator